jgi:hypothetical protein
MRRLALATIGALALALPAVSAASTSTTRDSFDAETLICNGDTVHLTGSLLDTFSVTATPSGGLLLALHSQPQGISGVDEQTGLTLRGTGLTRDVFVVSPAGGVVATFVNLFHLQATRGEQSFDVSEVAHVTVTPAGSVSVSFDHASVSC